MSKKKENRAKRSETMKQLLDKLEATMSSTDLKASLGDYIRLIQLQRELEAEEPVDIQVTWVDPETNHDAENKS